MDERRSGDDGRGPARAWSAVRDGLGPALLRDVVLVCLAVGVVGASYGAISVSGGLPVWQPSLMSVVVFAGASQFLFTGVVTSGGSVLAAVAAGVLVNLRHLPFGFALADVLAGSRRRQIFGSYVLVDEVAAFALAQPDLRTRRMVFAAVGIGLWSCWQVGTLVGALAGTAITDTDAWGLDAAFPAVLLALVLPSLRNRATRRAGLVGAAIALAATPFLPAGMPILLALLGLLAGGRGDREAS